VREPEPRSDALRRLRDEKVIVADIAVVNPALTGSALTNSSISRLIFGSLCMMRRRSVLRALSC